jgi:hypothetical protein
MLVLDGVYVFDDDANERDAFASKTPRRRRRASSGLGQAPGRLLPGPARRKLLASMSFSLLAEE